MKKKFLVVLSIFMLFNTVTYALSGLMSGDKNIKVTTTKYFDIIYAQGSEKSAYLLYENADRIYEEIAESYGYPITAKLPVVILNGIEIPNAAYGDKPYNFIVIFDTESMDVFTENILSVFTHELVHAYTLNLKNPFWQGFSKVFGDSMTPATLFINVGMAEGATVSYESSTGSGRLNNDYYRQYARQVKIEGNIPGVNDYNGCADNDYVGLFYFLHGEFDSWLQKKYGMEKYGKFWYEFVNHNCITENLLFKKIYGISMEEAWKNFWDEFEVPNVEGNPVKANLVKDFFDSTANDYSKKNNQGSLYNSLKVSEKGITYLDNNSVYFVSINDLQKNKIKPKKIYTQQNVVDTNTSDDGRFLIIHYYDTTTTMESKIKIVDLENKTSFIPKKHRICDASIIKNNGEYYFVYREYRAQECSLGIEKIIFSSNNKKIENLESITKIPFAWEEKFDSITDLHDGTFAYLRKSELNYSICIRDLQGNLIAEYGVPKEDRIVVHNLSLNENKLLFSYTKKDCLPSFGEFDLNEKNFKFYTKQLSGGIYEPSVVNNEVYYIGTFFKQNRLLKFQYENEESFTKLPVEPFVKVEPEFNLSVLKENSRKVNPIKYYSKGLLYPISGLTSDSYNTSKKESISFPFGVTYITSTPWMSDNLSLSAGWNYATNSAGFGFTFGSSDFTNFFSYSIGSTVEFNKYGWKQSTLDLSSGLNILCGKISSISLNESAFAYFGKPNKDDYSKSLGSAALKTDEKDLYVKNTVSVGYSNIHSVGNGRFDNSGFALNADLFYIYQAQVKPDFNKINNYWDLGFSGKINLPNLLPIENTYGLTCNLPVEINFGIFNYTNKPMYSNDFMKNKFKNDYSVLNIDTNMVLFAKDIQKAVSCLFINNISISAVHNFGINFDDVSSGYSWKITKLDYFFDRTKDKSLEYYNYVGGKINLIGTFNSMFMNSMTLGLDCGAYITSSRVKPSLTLSFDATF